MELQKLNIKTAKPLLRELFNEKKVWETHVAVKKALEKKGYDAEANNISRWLKKMGVVRDGKKGWVMGEKPLFDRNLEALDKAITDSGNFSYHLQSPLKIGFFKTKRYQNTMIADMMKQTFVDEILSIFCPNDEDIIVFYRRGIDKTGKKRKKSRLSVEIKKISSKMAKQEKKENE